MTDIVERLDQLVDDLGEGRACCGLDYIDAAVDAAAEITRLRAKVAKADKLAEAVTHEREMVCQDFGMQQDAATAVHNALAAYQATKEGG